MVLHTAHPKEKENFSTGRVCQLGCALSTVDSNNYGIRTTASGFFATLTLLRENCVYQVLSCPKPVGTRHNELFQRIARFAAYLLGDRYLRRPSHAVHTYLGQTSGT